MVSAMGARMPTPPQTRKCPMSNTSARSRRQPESDEQRIKETMDPAMG